MQFSFDKNINGIAEKVRDGFVCDHDESSS